MRASSLDHCGSLLTTQDSQTVVSLQRMGGKRCSSVQGHVPETLEGVRRVLCYILRPRGPVRSEPCSKSLGSL